MSAPAVSSTLTIRPMLRGDIQAVYAIEQRIFPNPWPLYSYYIEVESPSTHKWVAEIEDESGDSAIIGMVIVWLLGDEAHVGNIGVDRPFQQRGVGCRLLKTALQSLARLGALTATLEVRENNRAALALYHRFGFVQTGRRKEYYIDNREDALILTLPELSWASLDGLRCPGEFSAMRRSN